MSRSLHGAAIVAERLRSAGVDTLFGLPGVHNLALYQACHDVGLKIITNRHEQGAAYAADGMARATGRLGVALTTTGPGATNAITAIGEAWASHSPVMLIATDVPTSSRTKGVYRGGLHECIDQQAMFRPVVKQTFVCESVEQIASAIEEAIELALAAPQGPVYVEIPTDLLTANCDLSLTMPRVHISEAEPTPANWLQDCLDLLKVSKRPIVWVGGGGCDASSEIEALIDKLKAPVITTFHARNILPKGHPALIPVPPHEPVVARLIDQADLVLVIGSDLDGMMTQKWKMHLPKPRIAINVDGSDAVKNYAMDLVVVANSKIALAKLSAALPGRDRAWAPHGEAIEKEVFDELTSNSDTAESIQFLRSTASSLASDSIVFADMAVCGYWLSSYYSVSGPRFLHYPMGWGTLGFALPAAVGAAAVCKEPVVTFCGDGGALFALSELATIAQEKIPLTIVVVDDSGYGMLRFGREKDPRIGTELKSPDFTAVARAFGIEAECVEGVGDAYASALKRAVTARQPRLLHVKARLYPPRTTSPRWPLA